ncbi:MAG: response regulator [Pedosphaera sp.]|nr:response regulator [Pedosphaera sp.]
MTLKILTVDDSRIPRTHVRRALEPYDCELFEATNGVEGLAAAAKELPDLIILDSTMPVMDGLTMLQEMKANPQLTRIPVIMLTAESGRENVIAASKLGVRDYLTKPFQTEKLIEKVGRILILVAKRGISEYDDIAGRFGLEAIPESVLRLTRIIASKDASLDLIAEAISQDLVLTKRLLRAANPRYLDKAQIALSEVVAALSRTGLGFGVMLATGDALIRAVRSTFQTSLSITLQQIDVLPVPALVGTHVTGFAEFSGRANGRVQVRLSEKGASFIAGRCMGSDPEKPQSQEVIDDAVGETVTLVVGSFKSHLSNAGLNCVLTPPVVERTRDLELKTATGGVAERFGFRSPELTLFVDNSVNPWTA